MTVDGMSIIGTVTIEARIITTINMIVITPLATIIGGMTNGEIMQIQVGFGKDIRTIDATIKNGMLEERSIRNR